MINSISHFDQVVPDLVQSEIINSPVEEEVSPKERTKNTLLEKK